MIWQDETTMSTRWSGLPDDMPVEERAVIGADVASGVLIAWDPANQREVWRAERGFYSGSGPAFSTHGKPGVFRGILAGNFKAYTADTGTGGLVPTPRKAESWHRPSPIKLDGETVHRYRTGLGRGEQLAFRCH